MKSLLYSNNVIKSDYVKIKGKVSLNHFTSDDKSNDKQEIPDSEEIYNNEEKKLELLKLEEEINQKLIDAQAKYDEILNLANIESEKILAESRDNAMDIEKKAYHEGYEQGMKNGYEDGYKEAYEDNIEKAKSESSKILEKANEVILEANNQIASYIKENKKNILSIGISIAEKVLRRKFEDESSMDLLITFLYPRLNLKCFSPRHCSRYSVSSSLVMLSVTTVVPGCSFAIKAAAMATMPFLLISLPFLSTADDLSTSVSNIRPKSAPDSATLLQIEAMASLFSGFGA